MAEGPRKFGKPPLVEVYCEFVFMPAGGERWHGLGVCEFLRRIGGQYPNQEMLTPGSGQTHLHDEDDSEPFGVVDLDSPYPLFRFRSEDGSTIVQVGDNLLVVNQLPPYYGWGNFFPRIIEALEGYLNIWNPTSVAQAFLHYIDRVEVREREFALKDYFNLFPVLPEGFDRPFTNLMLSMDLEGCGKGDVLSVSIRQDTAINPDGNAFLFNWDYGSTDPIPLDTGLDGIAEWLEVAHGCCWDFFQAIFTDRCIALFEPTR